MSVWIITKQKEALFTSIWKRRKLNQIH